VIIPVGIFFEFQKKTAMNASNSALAHSALPVDTELLSPIERAIEFYEEATDDYKYWSRGFNMHLGFYRLGVGFLDREKMLEQMNLEVASRLRLDPEEGAVLIDVGCGVGAISRTISKNYPNSTIKGLTISPSQIATATRLNVLEGLADRIENIECDYRTMPFEDGFADCVWAVESACYGSGPAKEDFIREMARVLKPGGRFVIADCFLKRPARELKFPVKHCYSSVCKSWALVEMPMLDRFAAALEQHGFRDVLVEDISWRVAPSLAHAPAAVITFILKKIFSCEPLSRHRANNLKASLLAPVLGLSRSTFSYCFISGTLVV
jgi:MPBQ/MSBQ methyltransferase